MPRPQRFDTLPTANGGIARAAYAHALAARLDVDALLQRSGLTVEQVENATMRVPVRNQIRFLNAVAEEGRDEFLGVKLAEHIDPRELGLLYFVSASCDTLGDALQRVARYSTLHNEGVRITCHERAAIRVTFDFVGVARRSDRHQIEFIIALLLRVCRLITGLRVAPDRVRLAHRRTALPGQVRTFFGCDVEFGSGSDEVVLPRRAGRMPIVLADPYLNRLLTEFCDQALSRRRSRPGDWATAVENAIVPLLPHGRAEMAEVARRLGLSRRTLARRLAVEGLTFGDVLENLRLALAKRYLRDPGLQVSEVAWLLGYGEASAFSHAFRRWTGRAPRRAHPPTRRKAQPPLHAAGG